MVMLSGGADNLGTFVVAGGGGYGAWPELAGWFEERTVQVLEQAQALAGHGQAASATGADYALLSPSVRQLGYRAPQHRAAVPGRPGSCQGPASTSYRHPYS